MQPLRVAIVSREPDARSSAARAFDLAPSNWTVDLHTERPTGYDVVVFGSDVDCSSDELRIDPATPQRIVEEIGSRVAARGRRIVVSSVSGGTGTTSIALHLAAALAGRASTCTIDLAGGMGDRLGIDVSSSRTWDESGVLDEIELRALPVAGGFRALLLREPTTPLPDDLLPAIEKRFEKVVIDAPHTHARELLSENDTLIAITSGSPIAARRTARLLESISSCRLALVVNRVGRGGQTTRAQLERILGRRLTVELPHCPALRDLEDEAALLTSPVHRWKRGLDRLAVAL